MRGLGEALIKLGKEPSPREKPRRLKAQIRRNIRERLERGDEITYQDIEAMGVSYDQALGVMNQVRGAIWAESDLTRRVVGVFKQPEGGGGHAVKHFRIEPVSEYELSLRKPRRKRREETL